jgi:uncharacterized protein YecE (DUF72 family)
VKTGYTPAALDEWAARARSWSKGGTAEGLALIGAPERKPPKSRDVFVYMINGFKPKAPAAAMALIERLSVGKG